MINTNCLKRINHHHHYHDRDHEQKHPIRQAVASERTRNKLAKLIEFKKKQGMMHASGTTGRSGGCGRGVECGVGAANNRKEMQLIVRRTTRNSSPSSSLSSMTSLPISNRFAFIGLALTCTTLAIIILSTLTNEVSSLKCFSCSSADNPACDETFAAKANMSAVDCEEVISKPAKVCRKIVQYIEDKKVVIRSCGWIDEHADAKKSMCYKRSGTFALMMESCVCYEDNCNHSASLVPNQSVTMLLITGSTIIYHSLSSKLLPGHS